jgi:hypothetical protein
LQDPSFLALTPPGFDAEGGVASVRIGGGAHEPGTTGHDARLALDEAQVTCG